MSRLLLTLCFFLAWAGEGGAQGQVPSCLLYSCARDALVRRLDRRQQVRIEHSRTLRPEMEITEIILAKIYRFCQLSSHSRGFFLLRYTYVFKSIGLTCGILWRTKHHPMIQICLHSRTLRPEMEITDIMLAKIYRFCQLSRQCRGFLLRYRILNP